MRLFPSRHPMSGRREQRCGLPEHVINVARGIDLSPSAIGGCYVKSLPGELQQAAAITAAELYPPNAPKLSSPLDALLRPLQAAGTRFWGPQPRTLIVRFTEASSPQLEQKIVQYLNAWKCTVSFALALPHHPTADVRITLADQPSTWSYLGTDILHVPEDMPTVALPGVSMNMPEHELKRRVIHVAGHILGFHHQSIADRAVIQDIIPKEAYTWFRQTQGWNPSTVDELVLNPSPIPSAPGQATASTGSSQSVMAFWLPAGIKRTKVEAVGAPLITEADVTMCRAIYPTASSELG